MHAFCKHFCNEGHSYIHTQCLCLVSGHLRGGQIVSGRWRCSVVCPGKVWAMGLERMSGHCLESIWISRQCQESIWVSRERLERVGKMFQCYQGIWTMSRCRDSVQKVLAKCPDIVQKING